MFESYEVKVLEGLQSKVDDSCSEWSAAATDILEDMKRPAAPPYIKWCFDRGYAIKDAIRSICLTSDHWDEDWAISKQNILQEKYGNV